MTETSEDEKKQEQETPSFDGEVVQGGETSPDKDGTREELTGGE